MKTIKLFTALLLSLVLFLHCSTDKEDIEVVEQEQTDTENTTDNDDNESVDDSDNNTTENDNSNDDNEETTDDEGSSSDDNTTEVALELTANDLTAHPMQEIAKPDYLKTIIDPSFGTIIRRISDAGVGNVIKPMYSTIQAWNADESYMILYDQSKGLHQLLDGMDYSFIRFLDDIAPDDLEQIYWDFNDPNIFYYMDTNTTDLIKYKVNTREKFALTNLAAASGCSQNIESGNDVQMMSWDSDVIGFRCGNQNSYTYRISTQSVTQLNVNDVAYTAAMPSPSGDLSFHQGDIYNSNGTLRTSLNISGVEHACIGKLANGNDAYFGIAFDQGPQGGCIGNIIAHDMTTGECFDVISESLGYDYPKSGTHISAVAHKNPGWIAASMIGYDEDGQSLLDQELVVAKVNKGDVQVYRIGHHRADENEFDYWGEPHAVISPTGTRVLFGSDWSGSDDGKSVDSYVVELPAFSN